MRRREFITLLGGVAAAWPLTARAQQPVMPVIGFLSSRSPGESASVVAAFRQGLRETGFIEGQNLGIAFRWAEGRYDRLPALASELVSLPVTLLFAAGGPPSAFAAKGATSTIPVVFSAVSDPVEIGLVPSLNQPGGNLTGMGVFNSSLGTKRLELMKELMPNVAVIGYLLNPADGKGAIEKESVVAASRALGVEVRILTAKSETELDSTFAGLEGLRVRALVVSGEPFFDSQRERIVGLTAKYRVVTIYAWREYVLAGGLMSYGTDLPASYRQAAIYAGRILKGEKPANLPVVQPTKFLMAINGKTAKSLGIDVPPRLLGLADEVIE
ncbi:MAG: ABC transporter substrate-binding protein [Pseudolabrys sp.]|jgi:putative ABC transport system substrate-binding protein